MLVDNAKYQGYSFYHFSVSNGKAIEGVKLSSTQIVVNG